VVAQLMGHAKVDTTLNVYTQVLEGALRTPVDQVGSELITMCHKPETGGKLTHWRRLARRTGRFPTLCSSARPPNQACFRGSGFRGWDFGGQQLAQPCLSANSCAAANLVTDRAHCLDMASASS